MAKVKRIYKNDYYLLKERKRMAGYYAGGNLASKPRITYNPDRAVNFKGSDIKAMGDWWKDKWRLVRVASNLAG